MRISAIKHAVRCCWPDFKNSSADAKACEGNPTDFNMPCNALRTKSSSSTIATKFALLWMAITRNLAASSNLHNHTLVCQFSYLPTAFGIPWIAAPIKATVADANAVAGLRGYSWVSALGRVR